MMKLWEASQHRKKKNTHPSSSKYPTKQFPNWMCWGSARPRPALKRVLSLDLLCWFFFDRYKVLHPTLPAWFTNHSSHQRRDQMATCFCLPVGICNGTSIATSIREHEIRVIQKSSWLHPGKLTCWLVVGQLGNWEVDFLKSCFSNFGMLILKDFSPENWHVEPENPPLWKGNSSSVQLHFCLPCQFSRVYPSPSTWNTFLGLQQKDKSMYIVGFDLLGKPQPKNRIRYYIH